MSSCCTYLASILVVATRFPPSPCLWCIAVGSPLSPSSCKLDSLPALLPRQDATVTNTGMKRFIKLSSFLSRLASDCKVCATFLSWLVSLVVSHVTKSQGHLTFLLCGVDLQWVGQCWWLSSVRGISAITSVAMYTYVHSVYIITFLRHVLKCTAKACEGVGISSLCVCVCVCVCTCVCVCINFVCNRLATKVFIGKLSAMGWAQMIIG